MKTISTAREFFEQVVEYNFQLYKAQPTSLPAAYNLANALFSMHEWMWDTYGTRLETQLGGKLANATNLNTHVQSACYAFKYMRDVANASKHVSLSSPSTKASHISNTSVTGYGEGGYGIGGYGGGIVIDDGGTNVNFMTEASKVYDYWHELLMQIPKKAVND